MRIQVFDIGNSHLKCDIWDFTHPTSPPNLIYSNHTPTSRDMKDNLEVIQSYYDRNKKEAVIVLSMSDSIVYESPEGKPIWIPAGEPTHPYARLETKPPYRETGKPHREVLDGCFNQLRMVMTQMRSNNFYKSRILPFSGYVAAHLAGDKKFNKWDITHASNSGVFSYQLPSNDERFPKSGWHPCIEDIIEAGYINREIVKSDHILIAKDGTPILVGGHDTTFANALDIPYSTKPYISCGTWLTASVESSVRPNWKDEGARYIIAPNGAVLKQLCFESAQTDEGKVNAAKRIQDFLTKHTDGNVPITIFGRWRKTFRELINDEILDRPILMTHNNYLTEQAAVYALENL